MVSSAGPEHPSSTEFDHFADDYDRALDLGLALTGEDKDYFAVRRMEAVRVLLNGEALSPSRILDFGCGTGGSVRHLLSLARDTSVTGVDVSEQSLAVAQRLHSGVAARFETIDGFRGDGEYDLAFCNGVFHHIPPPDRSDAVATIRRALRPGGLFAFWENNPWNPGTRWVMKRIPFDRDAIPLSSIEARRLLRNVGFEIRSIGYHFVFPRFLRFARPIESYLEPLPIGGQYLILARA